MFFSSLKPANFEKWCCNFIHRSTHLVEAEAINYTIRTPVGVAGLICPWNLPLYLLSFKIAPAIAAGCTVVCKPSEMTSLTAHMLAKVMNEAGKEFEDEKQILFLTLSCHSLNARSISVHYVATLYRSSRIFRF